MKYFIKILNMFLIYDYMKIIKIIKVIDLVKKNLKDI